MTTPEAAAGTPGPPRLPDDVREAARLAPDHWLGVVDPAWTADAPPPHWAVVGEWRSGPTGEVEEWQPNEDYRPSPAALGWPAATDPVDAAVQLAVTGYGSVADAVTALAAADVTLLRAPGGEPLTAAGADGGSPVVPVFTARPHEAFASGLRHDTVAAAALARDLAASGVFLCVNPAGPARLVVAPGEVVDALVPARSAADGPSAPPSPVTTTATTTGRTP